MRNSEFWRKDFVDRLIIFSANIVLLSNKLPKSPSGFAISNQIVRSGTSVGANFIESQDASSTKDFIQKLSISLREVRETWYWLKVIERTNLLDYDDIKGELNECDELAAILTNSIKHSKSKL
jgi:four helix bundle protein